MATIKSFTSLEQSRKLAEILPLESADMEYMFLKRDSSKVSNIPFVKDDDESEWPDDSYYDFIPCWSLASLLSVLPKVINNETLFIETSPALWHIGYRDVYIARADNPVDACVEMIEKLHKQMIYDFNNN